MARSAYELIAQRDVEEGGGRGGGNGGDADGDAARDEADPDWEEKGFAEKRAPDAAALKERRPARTSLEALGIDEEATGAGVAYSQAPPQQCAPCGVARILGSCMMGLVVCLVVISYVPMMHFYADGTASGAMALLLFHVLLGLTLVSYFQTALTDPGTVPMAWHARVSKMRDPPYRKCSRSGYYKPPRSHFDSVTRRLVLNMDHFCPWVNNCVGYFNRKFFIQFVGYTFVTCLFAAISLYIMISSDRVAGLRIHSGIIRSSHSSSSSTFNKSTGKMSPSSSDGGASSLLAFFGGGDFALAMMTLLGAIIDAVFSISLSIFFFAHMWLASRNQTSIEGIYASRPYRLSRAENLQQVFGRKPLYWFLPLYGDGPVGDGVHWPRVDGSWDGLTTDDNSRSGSGTMMTMGAQVV